MKLLHDNGYSEEEKLAFREIIYSNTIQSMKVIMEAMDRMSIALSNPENEKYKNTIVSLPHQLETQVLPPEVAHAIKELWADAGTLQCYSRSNEYQLNDSAK
jgi:guanine nucleotide-binding protein subunit alpha